MGGGIWLPELLVWGMSGQQRALVQKVAGGPARGDRAGKASGRVGALSGLFCLSQLGRTQLYRVDMTVSNYSSIDTAAHRQQCDFLEYVM